MITNLSLYKTPLDKGIDLHYLSLDELVKCNHYKQHNTNALYIKTFPCFGSCIILSNVILQCYFTTEYLGFGSQNFTPVLPSAEYTWSISPHFSYPRPEHSPLSLLRDSMGLRDISVYMLIKNRIDIVLARILKSSIDTTGSISLSDYLQQRYYCTDINTDTVCEP